MHPVNIWNVVESIRRSSRENGSSLLIEESSIDNRRRSVEVLIENNQLNNQFFDIYLEPVWSGYHNFLRYRLAPMTQIKSQL